ncbi:MAG: hypothetical protein ACI8RD_006144 [Bacillariaceae sp.]|jgi:hypothetical protein
MGNNFETLSLFFEIPIKVGGQQRPITASLSTTLRTA